MAVRKNSITEASQTGFNTEPTTGDVFSYQASSHKVAALNVDHDGTVSI